MLPGEDDLYVEFFDSNLMVMVRDYMFCRGSITRCFSSFHAKHPCYQNPEFPPPYFVGGGDAESSIHDCSGYVQHLLSYLSRVDHSWLDNVAKSDSVPLNLDVRICITPHMEFRIDDIFF